MANAEFDEFADNYDRDLARGLSLTGEDKLFYAMARLLVVKRCLDRQGVVPRRVLDYGCGTGTAVPLLRQILGAETVVGVDPSTASLDKARAEYGERGAVFVPLGEYQPDQSFDLVFTNGVFHHIPRSARPDAVATVRKSLRPGGIFSLWENNPLNLGTRWVMKQVAFDRDAIMLRSGESAELLRQGGLEVLGTEFHFVFPRLFKWLRGLEPMLQRLPLGGQYQVLARRSG